MQLLFVFVCFVFLSFFLSSQESSLRPDVVILGAASVSCALARVTLLLLLLVNSPVLNLLSLPSPAPPPPAVVHQAARGQQRGPAAVPSQPDVHGGAAAEAGRPQRGLLAAAR